MNIFVARLDYGITDDDLRTAFEAYGEVESAIFIMDRETGRSRGFGFVEMPNDEEGRAAMVVASSALSLVVTVPSAGAVVSSALWAVLVSVAVAAVVAMIVAVAVAVTTVVVAMIVAVVMMIVVAVMTTVVVVMTTVEAAMTVIVVVVVTMTVVRTATTTTRSMMARIS